MNNNITYFGKTNSRGREVEFGIKDDDRLKHIYVIGKTGMGKSTLLENMAVQDIKRGNGLAFFDPHGSAIETFLDYIPEERINDVVYFAPFDVDYPISFNPLENTDPSKRYLVAQGLMAAFKKIFGEESFSDRMQHMTNNALLALLEYPGATLLHITRMLSDDAFRADVIEYITDPSVKAYWVNEYNMWDEKFRREASAAVLNKVGQFTTNPLIRNIVGQEKSSFDFREILDKRKILLVNLSKGQIGEDNANLLGSMLTTKLYLAAMSRADRSKEEIKQLPAFYLYIDEFQNLANDSFANILAEARKYKLSLILAHQYMEQMPDTIRAAVFGNIGTMIAFQVGAIDAEILEQQFAPVFTAEDFTNLGFTEIYLRMAIDGITSAPFSARTLPPIPKPEISFASEVIEASRKQFTLDREEAENVIRKWIEKKYSNPKELKEIEEKLDWEVEKYLKYGPKKYEPNNEVLEKAKRLLDFVSIEDEAKKRKKIKTEIKEVENKIEEIVEKGKDKVEKIIGVKEEKINLRDFLDDDEYFILEAQKKAGFLPEDYIPDKVRKIIELGNKEDDDREKEDDVLDKKSSEKKQEEKKEKVKKEKKRKNKNKKESKKKEKGDNKKEGVKNKNPFQTAFQASDDLKDFLKKIRKD